MEDSKFRFIIVAYVWKCEQEPPKASVLFCVVDTEDTEVHTREGAWRGQSHGVPCAGGRATNPPKNTKID